MKKISTLFLIVALASALGCAAGPGKGPEEENGLAGLSLQLHGLEAGEIYLTNDGYRLTFGHFALAFSAISLGDVETQALFDADFSDEEAADVVEIEEVPAGEYDAVTLTLVSVFLEAEAVNGSNACTVQVALAADGEIIEVEPEGNAVTVVAEEEAEVLVEVDPNAVFAGVDLGGLCQGDALVTISAAENSSLAQQISENLAGAFVLGSTEGGHHH